MFCLSPTMIFQRFSCLPASDLSFSLDVFSPTNAFPHVFQVFLPPAMLFLRFFYFLTRRPPSGSAQRDHVVKWLMCFCRFRPSPKIRYRLTEEAKKHINHFPVVRPRKNNMGFGTADERIQFINMTFGMFLKICSGPKFYYRLTLSLLKPISHFITLWISWKEPFLG